MRVFGHTERETMEQLQRVTDSIAEADKLLGTVEPRGIVLMAQARIQTALAILELTFAMSPEASDDDEATAQ